MIEIGIIYISTKRCIISEGPKSPHIVMGISGVPSELLNLDLVRRDKIPVIRRYSGGGTVVCESSTLFVSFILNKVSNL